MCSDSDKDQPDTQSPDSPTDGENAPGNDAESSGKQAAPKKKSNKRAYSFVLIFMVTVLALLIGYRYAVPTAANDWYLLQVARHTTVALSLVGEHAALEEDRPAGEEAQEIRAQRQAWREGRETPTEAEIEAAKEAPLSPWEYWSYRAQKSRKEEVPQQGPRVSFIWDAGIYRQIRDLEATIREESSGDPEWLDTEAGQETQAEMLALREQQREVAGTDAGRAQLRGDEFTFVVIPECGAIEIMAIFFAAVIAFPARWWKRLVGIVIGLPVMYAVNVFRLAVLAVIGAVDHSKEWFDFTHEYVWQTAYIIFVIVFWLLWVELVVRRGSNQKESDT